MSKWILLPDPGGGGSCAVAQILQYCLQKMGQIAWKTNDIFLLRATDKYTLHLIPRKKIYISLSLPNNGIGGLVQNRGFFLDCTEQSTVISRRTGTSPHNLGLRADSSESRTLGNILLNVIDLPRGDSSSHSSVWAAQSPTSSEPKLFVLAAQSLPFPREPGTFHRYARLCFV